MHIAPWAAFPLLAWFGEAAMGQCPLQWDQAAGFPGTDALVTASAQWDPDGAGPLPTGTLIGGLFTAIGSQACNQMAWLNPLTGAWDDIGRFGFQGMLIAPNGGLYVSDSNGYVLRRSGSQWVQVGTPINPTSTRAGVFAMAMTPSSQLFVASYSEVLLLLGNSWTSIGSFNSGVLAMQDYGSGIVIGGSFSSIAGVVAPWAAAWNGTAWQAMPGLTGSVSTLVKLQNGDLLAGCNSTTGPNLARWTGTAWVPHGGAFPQQQAVKSIVQLANGDLVVSGDFSSIAGVLVNGVARWDGTAWYPVGAGLPNVWTLTEASNGDLYAGGFFTRSLGAPANYLARFDGQAWQGSAGTDEAVVAIDDHGPAPVACGVFEVLEGVAGRVALWNGTGWTAVPGTLGSSFPHPLNAIATMPNGDIVIGWSGFPSVMRWNGSVWSAMNTGSSVVGFDFDAQGNLLAASAGGPRRWNGTAWTAVGTPLPGDTSGVIVTGILGLSNGDILVAGAVAPNQKVARWNGTSWSYLTGGPTSFPQSMIERPNGDILAVGSFDGAVTRWTGTAWVSLGTPSIRSRTLRNLPNGDLLAIGTGVSRWDGTAWTLLGTFSGTLAIPGTSGNGRTSAWLPDGRLLIGGSFSTFTPVGSSTATVSANLVRLQASCAPAISTAASGCATGAGPQLSSTTQPWIGGTIGLDVDGLPSGSACLGIGGFTPIAVPLSLLFPAVSGCQVLTTPDLIDVLPATAGRAHHTLAVPNSLALVGLAFHYQAGSFVTNAGGAIVSAATSNALTFTVGAF